MNRSGKNTLLVSEFAIHASAAMSIGAADGLFTGTCPANKLQAIETCICLPSWQGAPLHILQLLRWKNADGTCAVSSPLDVYTIGSVSAAQEASSFMGCIRTCSLPGCLHQIPCKHAALQRLRSSLQATTCEHFLSNIET